MNARRLMLATVVSLSLPVTAVLLVAPVAVAEELCPNTAARQGPSGALPDCRAYEQVTPTDKGDAQDLYPSLENGFGPTSDQGLPAEDGNHFLLNTESPLTSGDAFLSSFVFSRGTEGWTTTSLSPGPGINGVTTELFDPKDFSWVALNNYLYSHLPGQPEERTQATLAGPPSGPYTTVSSAPGLGPIIPREDRPNEKVFVRTYLGGAASDLSHVVIQSENHELAPGASGEDLGLVGAIYDWSGGHLQLVNVATNGSLLSPCGASLGEAGASAFSYFPGGTQNAVSSDGSKIFFNVPDVNAEEDNEEGPGCWNGEQNENPPQLYMRVDDATTALLSTPNTGVHDPDGPQPAIFVGASSDGSKAFFMTTAELTADDTTHAMELYEYNSEAPEGERLIRVSSGESGTAEGDVDFVAGISNNGSMVYFSAFGQLAQGAPALQEGEVNLYRYDTATGRTTYIATVDSKDYPASGSYNVGPWYSHILGLGEHRSQYAALATGGGWYLTPNGQYLLFSSERELTGFDNESPSGAQCQNLEDQGVQFNTKCTELFRYSAAGNSIACVSCFGTAPISNAMFGRDALTSPGIPSPRPISEDGSYVFFDTASALVPNATSGMLHVYEWHNGNISLISSPDDPGNAYFQGSTPDGSNVFFGTHAQLVPQDTDADGDVYDARIDGGFVGVTPPLCTGTGCQGVPSAPPIFATPSSVTFEGLGNFAAGGGTLVKPRTKALTSAQKLANALKACGRDRSKRKRARCEARARSQYGVAHKSKKSNRRGK